jgi:hypothetical protein
VIARTVHIIGESMEILDKEALLLVFKLTRITAISKKTHFSNLKRLKINILNQFVHNYHHNREVKVAVLRRMLIIYCRR